MHGFDLTFCAPKSVSRVRALRGDEAADKAVLAAHTTAIAEALEYLACHASYTRVHNPHTGEKDLVGLPALVAIAYQHETSRAGDPHLHTHVLVPNRQARGDGKLVSLDGTSLYHEARAAGVIYQATLRQQLHRLLGWSGRRSTLQRGWPKSPASTRRASPRGRSARLRCASGRRTIWSLSTPIRSRQRRSWRPPKRPPARANPNNSPGRNSRRTGGRMRAVCGLTAKRFWRRATLRRAWRAAAKAPLNRRRLVGGAPRR